MNTMDKTKYCSGCECELDRPHSQKANYVRAERFCEEKKVEKIIGLKHTEETRRRTEEYVEGLERSFEAGSAELANPENEDGISRDLFEEVDLSSPEEAKNTEELAYVVVEERTVQDQKTALVCPECTEEEDEIIWGRDQP